MKRALIALSLSAWSLSAYPDQFDRAETAVHLGGIDADIESITAARLRDKAHLCIAPVIASVVRETTLQRDPRACRNLDEFCRTHIQCREIGPLTTAANPVRPKTGHLHIDAAGRWHVAGLDVEAADAALDSDASASTVSGKLREDDPRIAFGAALVALVLIGGLIVLAGGALS